MGAERLRAHLRRPAATRRAAADLLGRRRVFMAGAVFFTTASLLCGLAWSPAALLAARVVQSAGAAIMTPTALSIISTTFTEGAERNKALGIWGALAASAPPPRG
jgi:MFS family permease